MMVLMLMAAWDSKIVDVKGAFLLGELEQNEQIYMEIPEGFEQFYDADCLLLLLKTLYGLKQAAQIHASRSCCIDCTRLPNCMQAVDCTKLPKCIPAVRV